MEYYVNADDECTSLKSEESKPFSLEDTAMSKKLINSIESCVDDAIVGLLYSDATLNKVAHNNVVVRSDINAVKEKQVTILSGKFYH